jgi:hypothetical protein
MYGTPRPTMPTVPPMRRGHEGSASGASGAAMSSTSMKNVRTGPMPSRFCALSYIAGSDGAVPPLR